MEIENLTKSLEDRVIEILNKKHTILNIKMIFLIIFIFESYLNFKIIYSFISYIFSVFIIIR